jgi:hypothetical protein
MALITQTGKLYYEGEDGTQRSGDENYGSYQFISLEDIVNNFVVAYVGEDKIISKIKRTDVAFHAQRALQELSYDTFKSIKSLEIVLPPSLSMILPQDYVNYVKFTWSDGAGVEHVIYPASKTSNPTDVAQDSDGNYTFADGELETDNVSTTLESYQTASDSSGPNTDYDEPEDFDDTRYGLDPSFAQVNGSFYIDPNTGLVHFSSNLSGQTVTIKYISDSLGTDDEMQVHKFAEEAMYKWIAHAILATRANTQEYLVARFKKERFAAVRTAKLRLSNLKIEELTQILRGKSKHIKH